MPESQVVSIRLNGSLADDIPARTSVMQSHSVIARRDLERYYEMLRRALPVVSVEEAHILVGALNGVLTMPQSASLLWANVEDYLRGQGLGSTRMEREFVVRLRRLAPFECLAIEDAVERFYTLTGGDASVEDRLRLVGLVRREQ